MPHPMHLHHHTPAVRAIEPHGWPVRAVAYHRRQVSIEPETRTGRQSYDALGRLRAQWDARLWADGRDAAEPNQSTHYGMSGRPLRNVSVDAGWRMALFDDAGQAREGWDGRGTHRLTDFDEQLRPLSMTEQMDGGLPYCVERFTYGGSTEVATNRCGQMFRHDDTAGSWSMPAYGLHGGTLAASQRFLADLAIPDWPIAVAERDALLETDAEGFELSYVTRWRYDASGAPWEQIDAAGHTRRSSLDVAGRPVWVDFQPAGTPAATLLFLEIAFDAFGRTIAEMAGNGVVTRTTWSAVDGRLQHRQASLMTQRLQDVHYTYDPVSNVTRIEDRAQPTTWFDGSQVDPVSTYGYDTLYQLIEATGRESVQATSGSALPGLVLPGGGDANRLRMYRQVYIYDAGGNLRILDHLGSDQTQYTRLMAVAARSNRSLFQPPGTPPPDFIAAFDLNGNQQALDGKPMDWDARNQLQRVTQFVRADAANDDETYVYGGDGMRRRKVRKTRAKAIAHVYDVRYLPGLEFHRNTGTGEVWDVASIPAGRSCVRWMHWRTVGRHASNPGSAASPPQVRYSVDDHLASSTLDLDDQANVISHEGYYPFGGTAWWAARSEVDATYKTIRYSGKERDATGLYYYGFRYYAPWLCRWINPDPAGDVDGLNRYAFVGCNPVARMDDSGLRGEDPDPEGTVARVENVSTFLRGIRAPLWTTEPNRRAVELLHQSIHLARRIATRAMSNLRSGPPPVRQRINDSLARIFQLGEDTPDGDGGFGDIRTWAADQLDPIRRSLNRRLRPGNDGIVWYSSEGAIAQVVRTDPRERIFMNLAIVETHDRATLAEILIHEESHFQSRADTSDVKYFTTTHPGNRVAPLRRVADVMRRYEPALGEAEAYIAPDESTDESRAELVVMRDHFGGDAAYYDAPDDERRMGMLMHNADTLAVIAMISGAEAVVDWDRRRPPVRRIPGPGQASHAARHPY